MLRRILVLLVFGSLVLSACGGGDDGGSTADGGATGGDAGTTGGGDVGGVGAIDAVQCAQVAAAMASAAGAAQQAASGADADLETALEEIQAFADAAPEEIRADVQTLAEGYAAFAQIFRDAGFDPTSGQAPPPEVIAQLQEAAATLQAQDFQAAAQRVSAFFQQECPT